MTGTYERELERAIAEVARGREVVHIEVRNSGLSKGIDGDNFHGFKVVDDFKGTNPA